MKHIKTYNQLTESIKYPESSYKNTDEFKYSFTIYLDGGDKHHTDFYNLEGAKEMKRILDNDGETYQITEWDLDGKGDPISSL